MKAPVRWACTWVQLAVWALTIGVTRALRTPKPPAGERPLPRPEARAPSPARAPLPGPILRAGGNFTRTRRITTDIDETCGCAITHDSKLPGIVMEPCGQHEFVLDDWERRLPA